MNNDTITLPPDGDPPMTDTNFYEGVSVLLAPFVLIPASIITARLLKYIWKIYEAKKYGYGDGIFEDPLAELGLKMNRGYDNTEDIRKLRKENLRAEKESQKRRISEANRNKINEMILKSGTEDGVDVSRPTFKLPKFVPIQAAGTYFNELKRQTTKTWFERLSPDAVRRWVETSKYARLWMVIQVTTTILAIFNYVSLTYLASNDDRDERNLIKNLDVVYAMLFLVDYCLSFYIAEDRLRFYFNGMSLIDLVSIVSPLVYLFVASPTKYIWFIGFIRIFRATRILRTYRLLSFTQSEQTRELTLFTLNFLNFIFFSASIINATESLDISPKPPSLTRWHDSLYYIMVTFSTIGFGDLSPTSDFSRVVVMLLIVLVILYVPWQTGKILEIFNSLSRYQRAQHTPSTAEPHIILAGEMTYSTIVDFCREYFVADNISKIVILDYNEPVIEMRRLLAHPFYRNRLTFLRGDLLSVEDLRRAQAAFATGLFLLNSNLTEGSSCAIDDEVEMKDAGELDSQLLMKCLYAKTNFPGLPIFAQLNDSRSKDLSNHCGIDRGICLDEFKSSLFAANCVCPGIQTFILNLIHCYKEVYSEIDKEFWTQEYQCGVANQVSSFKIPVGLVGIKFSEAAKEIYDNYNTIIFALSTFNSGFNTNEIRFNIPRNYLLKPDDVAFCITDLGDELTLRIAYHFKENFHREDLEQKDLELELNQVIQSSVVVESSPFIAFPNEAALSTPIGSQFAEVSIGEVPDTLNNHLIISGYLPSRIILHFVKALRSAVVNLPMSQATKSCHKDTPIVFILENLPDEWPKVDFLVELIDGANVKYFTNRQIDWDTNNLRIQSILNNYALGVNDRQALYRSFRAEGLEKQSIVYKLVQFIFSTDNQDAKRKPNKPIVQANDGYESVADLIPEKETEEVSSKPNKEIPITEVYLQRALEEAELSNSGLSPFPVYHFDRHFAAGKVASASFMQSLLCQSFFRPFIIEVIRGLIKNVHSVPIKESYAGKKYVEVVHACLLQGYIPLGLYRIDATNSDTLPYVYTNCRQGDIVKKDDYVFVIKFD
ncbi:hypothetical protein HDV02_005430 [Globomyces sp. JEL0801]|nr:hypothetical protein HDV02_005430 [Globomyces sp. JEL0801]